MMFDEDECSVCGLHFKNTDTFRHADTDPTKTVTQTLAAGSGSASSFFLDLHKNTQSFGSTPVICHLACARPNPYVVCGTSACVVHEDGTRSSNEPIVLDDLARERLRARCTQLHEAWTAAPRPKPHSDVTFTVASNDDLTQSLYQCHALYKAAFNVTNCIEDRQAIVCGWLAGQREPVCSCRLTMVKTLRECAIVGCDMYGGELEPVDTADRTSVDTEVGCMKIDNFVVHPSYQRQKIGTALAGHVKKWARERSRGFMNRLWLLVDYDKLSNCEFYSKLGFQIEDLDDDVSEVMMSYYYEDDPGLDRP